MLLIAAVEVQAKETAGCVLRCQRRGDGGQVEEGVGGAEGAVVGGRGCGRRRRIGGCRQAVSVKREYSGYCTWVPINLPIKNTAATLRRTYYYISYGITSD